MGWQSGEDRETGGAPVPAPGVLGNSPASPTSGASSALSGLAPDNRTPRDERLSGFGRGSEWDDCPPGPELAAVLAAVAGREWRCPGAEPDELIGVLRRLAALESWASAAKLGVIRELIRQDDLPGLARPRHGDLPDQWSDSVNHELALALAVSVQSAEKTALTAWELGARLPGIAALHADGTLAYSKARLIAETFQQLSDEDAAKAEALILPQLTGATGKTFGQIVNLAARIANEVDPGLAERRRKAAVQHASRVRMFREQSGAAGLSGRDLPADETLAAYANVTARAAEYKDSGVFPDARMDQFRTAAYLDLINGVTADTRIAYGFLSTDGPDLEAAPGTGLTMDLADDDPDDGAPGGSETGEPTQTPLRGQPDGRPVLADLTVPLATLLGLAERPGEGHGLGVLDPDLCRRLAELAAASAHSQVCVTVTDPDGIAIGHGCGRTGKRLNSAVGPVPAGAPPPPVALPATVNLTITADRLSAMLSGATGPPGKSDSRTSAGWGLTRRDRDSPDDPAWCGTWTLTLPSGQELAVRIEPVPTHACDHRHESHAYQPNDALRHLVQIRDYTCTFPSCSRHARESDFEHAQPYDKGGRTCSCNAGARSRRCHRVKQSPGWQVTQPKPGWHEWTTPSGQNVHPAPLSISGVSELPPGRHHGRSTTGNPHLGGNLADHPRQPPAVTT
jgi:hypothetical protein